MKMFVTAAEWAALGHPASMALGDPDNICVRAVATRLALTTEQVAAVLGADLEVEVLETVTSRFAA